MRNSVATVAHACIYHELLCARISVESAMTRVLPLHLTSPKTAKPRECESTWLPSAVTFYLHVHEFAAERTHNTQHIMHARKSASG